MYSIRVAESKKVLDRVNTYYDAVEVIKEAEIRDKENNEYVEDYYEIYDEARDEIVVDEPHWRYNTQENIMEMLAYDLGISTENGQTTIVTVGEGCASYLTVDNERAIQLAKFILETIDNDTPKEYTVTFNKRDGEQYTQAVIGKNREDVVLKCIPTMDKVDAHSCFIELMDKVINEVYQIGIVRNKGGKISFINYHDDTIYEVNDGEFTAIGKLESEGE